MGDRTNVSLTVLKQHVKETITLIEPEEGEPLEQDSFDEETVTITYEGVNYGTIDVLQKFARIGIPYSCQSGSGSDYDEAEEHLRFLEDGTPVCVTFSKEWPENTILECLEAIKDHTDPVAALQELLNQNQEPSWENQLAYSNVARALNLIQR